MRPYASRIMVLQRINLNVAKILVNSWFKLNMSGVYLDVDACRHWVFFVGWMRPQWLYLFVSLCVGGALSPNSLPQKCLELKSWLCAPRNALHTTHHGDLCSVSLSGKILTKSQSSREIGSFYFPVSFKCHGRLGTGAAESPVKIQTNWIILNTNLATLRSYENTSYRIFQVPVTAFINMN